MKKRFLAALAAGLLVVGVVGVASASLINYIDKNNNEIPETSVGSVDSLYDTAVLKDGDPFVKIWLAGLFGGTKGDYVLTKDDSPTLYQVYDDAHVKLTQVFAYDLPFDSDYFIVKIGTGSLPEGTPDHYLFTNLFDRNWGVFSYSEMGLPESANLDIFRVSHITQFNGSPVPEPATMLLFGTGLIGLAGVARRKTKA